MCSCICDCPECNYFTRLDDQREECAEYGCKICQDILWKKTGIPYDAALYAALYATRHAPQITDSIQRHSIHLNQQNTDTISANKTQYANTNQYADTAQYADTMMSVSKCSERDQSNLKPD